MAAKRTTHRSTTGKKLYAVRNADGSFKDIQTYKHAHSADLRKTKTAGDAKVSMKTKVSGAVKKVISKVATKVKAAKSAVKKVVKKKAVAKKK